MFCRLRILYAYGDPNTLMALVQRRHMDQYGTTLQQIGKIAVGHIDWVQAPGKEWSFVRVHQTIGCEFV